MDTISIGEITTNDVLPSLEEQFETTCKVQYGEYCLVVSHSEGKL